MWPWTLTRKCARLAVSLLLTSTSRMAAFACRTWVCLLRAALHSQTVFFEFLRLWGGEWMWTNIVNEGPDFQWVVDALTNGTSIWVTDRSYNLTVTPTVSGAG